jgi:hypothetical protein
MASQGLKLLSIILSVARWQEGRKIIQGCGAVLDKGFAVAAADEGAEEAVARFQTI